ncbi:MAG: hypothetical protein U0736_27625 [Gemmataceae bacterium]
MNGLIRAAMIVLAAGAAATGAGCQTTMPSGCGADGCGAACAAGKGGADMNGQAGYSCKDLYDRCWPARYSNLAHRSVNRSFTPQVQNGHVLEQTVWNHHFECGSAALNPSGLATLQQISRRRPEPDRTVYVATALDLPYDPACPERYCAARQELDALRVAAVQKYLVGLNCGRCQDYQVLVHDPADVSIAATPANMMVQQMYGRFRAGLGGPSGGGTAPGPVGSVGGFAGGGGAAGR